MSVEYMAEKIMGKNLEKNVIPTVCNLKNMLSKLREVGWDYTQLKQWEKRSYKAYNIQEIRMMLQGVDESEWPNIIKGHILTTHSGSLGANCIDIYIVGYVANTYGIGKDIFQKYILEKEITTTKGSINAIWHVGKGDGVYLGILNNDGSVKDYDFMKKWIEKTN